NGLILPGETRTVAEVTRAVARVKGNEPRLQLLVNALVTLGRGDGWGSTNANAAALRALAERLSPPLPGTGRHTVRVRLGSELKTLALGPEAPLGRLVATAAEDGEVALEPGKDAGGLGVRAVGAPRRGRACFRSRGAPRRPSTRGSPYISPRSPKGGASPPQPRAPRPAAASSSPPRRRR